MNRAMEMTSSTVLLDNGMKVPFDVCIVATGSVNNTFGVDGADQFALPMKSVEQCQVIARKLHRASLSHRTTRVTVVGGAHGQWWHIGKHCTASSSRDAHQHQVVCVYMPH